MNDPIVDEVRRIRDEHAARFNYDLRAIFADIQEQQRKSGLKFVTLTECDDAEQRDQDLLSGSMTSSPERAP
jgi:hypothetical protein